MNRRITAVVAGAVFLCVPALSLAQNQGSTQSMDSVLTVDRRGPVAFSNSTIGLNSKKNVEVCFTYRNLTATPASSFEFSFYIYDQFNNERLSKKNYVVTPQSTVYPGGTASACMDTGISGQAASGAVSGVTDSGKVVLEVNGISYASGAVWHTGDSFTRAYAYDGSAYVYTPPSFNLTWYGVPDGAPVAVTASSVESFSDVLDGNKPKFRQCTTFRTVTNKTASSIKIVYLFENGDYHRVDGYTHTFAGTFTPPILIQDKCWAMPLMSEAMVRSIRHEKIEVTAVTFTDGSQWISNSAWFKAYTNDGVAYTGPQPQPKPQASGSTNGTPAPAATSNPNMIGGVVGPTGQLYGEIYWDRLNSVAISVNQSSYVNAAIDAGAKCQAHSSSPSSCAAIIGQTGAGLNSPATRCAVLLFDGRHYVLGVGRDPDAAAADSVNKMVTAGGHVDGARTLAKGCNDQ